MAEHARSLIRPYYPALNGLRAIAILMVFVTHFGGLVVDPSLSGKFWAGVDLFFVLSGFLITGILYQAKHTSSFFRVFYIRRALRIFPIYYGFFLAVLLLTPVLKLQYRPVIWTHLGYVANLFLAAGHNPTVIMVVRFAPLHMEITLGNLWSLCVEEQFYLVWPLIIFLLPTRRWMMYFCGFAIVFTVCLRTYLFFYHPGKGVGANYLYYATFTRCDPLFAGAWLALWLREAKLTVRHVRGIALSLIIGWMAILVAGALTVGKGWPMNPMNPLICTYGYTVIAGIGVGVLMLALEETSSVHRVLKNRHLEALGSVSYGFYFIQGMFQSLFLRAGHEFRRGRLSWLFFLAEFFLTYGLAWLSFRYLESPFLKLKGVLAPGHASIPSGREDAPLSNVVA